MFSLVASWSSLDKLLGVTSEFELVETERHEGKELEIMLLEDRC